MKIVFTPDWFLTNDVLIEIFSFGILFIFFLLALKSYRMGNKTSVFYLGIGFLLIAVAEFASILTKFVLYYDTDFTQEIGRVIVTSNIVNSIDIFYHIGFFFNRFLTLLGLYTIYKIPSEKKMSKDLFLTIYLIFVAALLSYSLYYIYHLTSLILLIFIVRNYYTVYLKEKLRSTGILIIAFSLLALGQVIFLLSKLEAVYVTAQTIQLISYIMLLVLIMRILQNGKKKKQTGNNI